MKSDHRSKFSSLSNWKEEAWEYQGFNGIQTRDLRNTGAMLNQLSCEAADWERGQFVEFISTHAVKNTNMKIQIWISYVYISHNYNIITIFTHKFWNSDRDEPLF